MPKLFKLTKVLQKMYASFVTSQVLMRHNSTTTAIAVMVFFSLIYKTIGYRTLIGFFPYVIDTNEYRTLIGFLLIFMTIEYRTLIFFIF